MSAGSFQACDAFVAAQEGGYQNDPGDPGNWYQGELVGTNRGISAPVLSAWLGEAATAPVMQSLTETTAAAIRESDYWDAIDGSALPAGVDLMVYDDAINRGVGAAAKTLQGLVNVVQDGDIGPITIAATASADPADLLVGLAHEQGQSYLGENDAPQFIRGWLTRLGARLSAAAARLA